MTSLLALDSLAAMGASQGTADSTIRIQSPRCGVTHPDDWPPTAAQSV
jgi:hypothetical protein